MAMLPLANARGAIRLANTAEYSLFVMFERRIHRRICDTNAAVKHKFLCCIARAARSTSTSKRPVRMSVSNKDRNKTAPRSLLDSRSPGCDCCEPIIHLQLSDFETSGIVTARVSQQRCIGTSQRGFHRGRNSSAVCVHWCACCACSLDLLLGSEP